MGTVFSFLVEQSDLTTHEVSHAIEKACALLHRFEDTYSLFKPDSPINRFRAGLAANLPDDFDEILELSALATNLSAGYFDPWTPDGFDPTGIVKGFAGEQALALLADEGIPAALINAGGDVAMLSGTTYRIGIRHPMDPEALCGVINVDEGAVATSGTYERGSHLYHPFGGIPTTVAATVVGERLSITDALATAVAVGGGDMLARLELIPGFEGLYITQNGELVRTSGIDLHGA
ncbi:MAG: FAD:protein FMN transferase [Ferrimicrobium sp.]